ncbi:hypothetical protein KSP39_PZI020311 [Platanthera zijinensis]|uniref:Uncharacterized protein n=1 Tax=Platanthera zijinensis TaxID=2320716 RepID=A0AAP0AZA2_9ASPA
MGFTSITSAHWELSPAVTLSSHDINRTTDLSQSRVHTQNIHLLTGLYQNSNMQYPKTLNSTLFSTKYSPACKSKHQQFRPTCPDGIHTCLCSYNDPSSICNFYLGYSVSTQMKYLTPSIDEDSIQRYQIRGLSCPSIRKESRYPRSTFRSHELVIDQNGINHNTFLFAYLALTRDSNRFPFFFAGFRRSIDHLALEQWSPTYCHFDPTDFEYFEIRTKSGEEADVGLIPKDLARNCPREGEVVLSREEVDLDERLDGGLLRSRPRLLLVLEMNELVDSGSYCAEGCRVVGNGLQDTCRLGFAARCMNGRGQLALDDEEGTIRTENGEDGC